MGTPKTIPPTPPKPPREPEWVRRAKEGRLPNSDRTGQVAA